MKRLFSLFRGSSPPAPIVVRSPAQQAEADANAFSIEGYVDWLVEVRRRGARFETLQRPDLAAASAARVQYVKHDIHHDLANTVAMARAEAAAGLATTYFMMHRDPINRSYFDTPECWRALGEIRDLGHAIGLHIDGFTLVATFGDLAAGVEDALATFRRNGFDISIANTHGNSRKQAETGFETPNFYREIALPNRCEDPTWAPHYRRYSIQELGFSVWADTAIWTPATGSVVLDRFVSDNSASLRAGEPGRDGWVVEGERFDLSPALAARLADYAAAGSCIYLIHPQFFRPTAPSDR